MKLQPLNKSALSSQLYNLTGKFLSDSDFIRNNDEVIEISTGKKFCFPSQKEEEIFKAQDKIRMEKEKEEREHRHDNKTYPFIDLHNSERWRGGLDHAKTKGFPKTEMCEDAYWHFLECVPPKRMARGGFVCGEPHSHNSQGEAVYLCGTKEGNKYFAKYGTLKQFDSNKLF